MRERPIADLVDGLKQLGADAECILGTKCPPVKINVAGGLPGGKVWLIHMGFFCFLLSQLSEELC